MTPKDKALELINKYSTLKSDYEDIMSYSICKECALIANNESLIGLKMYLSELYKKQNITPNEYIIQAVAVEYYQQIKIEIEKL